MKIPNLYHAVLERRLDTICLAWLHSILLRTNTGQETLADDF